MKILHLIDSGGLYGAEKMLISLAAQQQRLGVTVVIGSIRRPGLIDKPLEREARLKGVAVEVFEMRPGPNVFGALRVLKYVWHNQFDLLHSHGYKTNILLGLLPRIIRRVPLVSTLHGWTSTGTWTKMRVNELLDSIALRFVDRIVLVNQGMLSKQEIQTLPRNKINIIDNGIDVSIDNELVFEKEEGDFTENRIKAFCRQGVVIASIGRLSIEKGYNYLIEAVARIRKDESENVRLLLIGDGRLRSELQKQAEDAGLKDSFLITGYVDNARRLISKVDIYAISSLTEGLPISLLEAMASGTPIVATAVGGIPHVVEEGQDALLVPPGNGLALKDAIVRLVHNPDLGRCVAARAEIKVKQNYSSEAMAEKYSAMYVEVLNS
jgi:glycosyltransferase involved in cell wall biosynthesis